MTSKACRIAVFYDGTYLNKVSNYYLYQHERHARLSVKGLHEFIVAEVAKAENTDARMCQIVDASYFRGRLTAPMAQERERLFAERMFEDMLLRADVNLFQQHVSVLPDGSFEERRIDVWMALEAYEMTSLKHYDVCVLLTGDGDFVPLVRKLNALGARVMLLGWDFSFEREGKQHRTQVSAALIDRVNYPVMMDKVIDARERRGDPLVNNLFQPRAPEGQARAPREPSAPAAAALPVVEGQLCEGTIANLLTDKGFGFVRPADGGDNLFFHVSELIDTTLDALEVQDPVSYVLARSERGPVARQVRRRTTAG